MSSDVTEVDEAFVAPDSINTFYYAYCSTERKRIGGATNQHTIANNTIRHHMRETGHEGFVESDKIVDETLKGAQGVEFHPAVACGGNACGNILAQVLPGPSIRLRNTHASRSIDVKVHWSTVMGGGWTTFNVFPGDDTVFEGPGAPYIGVSHIEANFA